MRLLLVQVAKEAAQQLQSVAGHVAMFDRKRKQEMALKLQQRWQRWEISNFDYLMQVPAVPAASSDASLQVCQHCWQKRCLAAMPPASLHAGLVT